MVVILSLIDTSYFFSFCHRCKLPIGENRVFVLVMKEEKQNFPQRIMYISEETQTVFIVNRWVKLSGIAFYCVFSIEPWKVALYSKLHSIQERCSILGESFISQSNQIRTDAVNKLIWLLVDIKKHETSHLYFILFTKVYNSSISEKSSGISALLIMLIQPISDGIGSRNQFDLFIPFYPLFCITILIISARVQWIFEKNI